MSTLIPVGSTITRIYFTVRPYSGAVYSVGPEHETFESAREAALKEWDNTVALAAKNERDLTDVQRPLIVERWVLAHPHVGGIQGRTDMQVMHDELTDNMIHAAKRYAELTDGRKL